MEERQPHARQEPLAEIHHEGQRAAVVEALGVGTWRVVEVLDLAPKSMSLALVQGLEGQVMLEHVPSAVHHRLARRRAQRVVRAVPLLADLGLVLGGDEAAAASACVDQRDHREH